MMDTPTNKRHLTLGQLIGWAIAGLVLIAGIAAVKRVAHLRPIPAHPPEYWTRTLADGRVVEVVSVEIEPQKPPVWHPNGTILRPWPARVNPRNIDPRTQVERLIRYRVRGETRGSRAPIKARYRTPREQAYHDFKIHLTNTYTAESFAGEAVIEMARVRPPSPVITLGIGLPDAAPLTSITVPRAQWDTDVAITIPGGEPAGRLRIRPSVDAMGSRVYHVMLSDARGEPTTYAVYASAVDAEGRPLDGEMVAEGGIAMLLPSRDVREHADRVARIHCDIYACTWAEFDDLHLWPDTESK